jgi:hypothetical protein
MKKYYTKVLIYPFKTRIVDDLIKVSWALVQPDHRRAGFVLQESSTFASVAA